MIKITPKQKKLIYYILFVFFGAEFGAFVAFLSWCITSALSDYWILSTCWYITVLIFVIIGTVFGMWAGPVAWRKIYIEGVRGKKYIIKK